MKPTRRADNLLPKACLQMNIFRLKAKAAPDFNAISGTQSRMDTCEITLTKQAKTNVNLYPGNGAISRLCHEPKVATAVLIDLNPFRFKYYLAPLSPPECETDCCKQKYRDYPYHQWLLPFAPCRVEYHRIGRVHVCICPKTQKRTRLISGKTVHYSKIFRNLS